MKLICSLKFTVTLFGWYKVLLQMLQKVKKQLRGPDFLEGGKKKKKQPEAKLQVQRSLHYNLGQRE